MTSSGQKLIRAKIEEWGSVRLQCHKSTPWNLGTIRALCRAGYKARQVEPHAEGTVWIVSK